jgi:hypothetical protein
MPILSVLSTQNETEPTVIVHDLSDAGIILISQKTTIRRGKTNFVLTNFAHSLAT